MNQTKTSKRSKLGSYTASKSCRRKRQIKPCGVSTTCVVAYLLTLSRPHAASVCAFIPSVQTKPIKRILQLRVTAPLNNSSIEREPTLKDRFQKSNSEISDARSNLNDAWKDFIRGRSHNDENSSCETDQQSVLDSYLESIDRRYKRVHQTDTTDDTNQRTFTNAWTWLTANESSTKQEEKQRSKEDALYVLGLAQLASARLIRKHHLPVGQSHGRLQKNSRSITIDVRGENDIESTPFIQAAHVAKACVRFLTSMYRTYIYHCIIVSLQIRAGIYDTLRRVRTTSSKLLATLSSTVLSTRGSKLTLLFATGIAATIIAVLTRLLKD